jgi:hypothetical protein
MMDEEYTIEDWKEFERRVLDDPKKSSEWANRVIDAWIRRSQGSHEGGQSEEIHIRPIA